MIESYRSLGLGMGVGFRAWWMLLILVVAASESSRSLALNNQQTEWLTRRLPHGSGTEGSVHGSTSASLRGESQTGRRHLLSRDTSPQSETNSMKPFPSANGWRARLLTEDHPAHTLVKLTDVERIRRSAVRSKARAHALDARARKAPYTNYDAKDDKDHVTTPTKGRKMLQSSDVIVRGSIFRNRFTNVAIAPPPVQSLAPAPTQSFESFVGTTPGSYSMEFSIGTPPQKFTAIADTGSDLVWVQGIACTMCFPQTTPQFDPNLSSTYSPIGCTTACTTLGSNMLQCSPSCQYTYGYGDQSTTAGDFSLDTVTLASMSGNTSTLVPGFQFGYGLRNQGTFTGTDGIVGLARGPLSFPSQIASYLDGINKFSYCLVSRYEDATVTSPIIFGAAAVPNNTTGVPVTYTPMQTPYDPTLVPYYYVNLLDISVGSVKLGISPSAFQLDPAGNGGTIFDSGTTFTVLAKAAYTDVLNEFSSQIASSAAYPPIDLLHSVGLDLCYDVTGIALTSVVIPNVVFHFENADFDLPFDNIVVLFKEGASTYMCLTMLETNGLNIFGNSQQQNFQVVYEEDTKQIGWVSRDCSTL